MSNSLYRRGGSGSILAMWLWVVVILLGAVPAFGQQKPPVDIATDIPQGSTSFLTLRFTEPDHCSTSTTVFCNSAADCPASETCSAGPDVTPSQVTYAIRDRATNAVLLATVTDNAVGAAAKTYTIPAAANTVHSTDGKLVWEVHTLAIAYSWGAGTRTSEKTFNVLNLKNLP